MLWLFSRTFHRIPSIENSKKQTRLLTFLSSLACFLWATVDLAGRGWPASVVALGLISFRFVALVLVLVKRERRRFGAAGLECAEETESLLFMRALRVRGGGNTSH